MNEFLIPLENLFLFLNGLFLNGANTFKVKSSLLDKLSDRELFWVILSGPREVSQVGGLIPKDIYEELRGKCGGVMGEIPTYRCYLDMFLASGVYKPKDWTRIEKTVLDELRRDPLRGERPVFISFDTNAFVRRYYTLVSSLLASNRLRAGFVSSKGVLAELEPFDDKYQASDIFQLGDALRVESDVLDAFLNQLKLGCRLFRMGFVEYRKMSIREYFEELRGGRGDLQILGALQKFSKERNVDLLVFSEDEAFTDRATALKLKGIRLDRQEEPPMSTEVDWEDVAQLLYTAAITYGVIGITAKTRAKIHGVWRGKKAEHWNTETLKITTENPELQKFLETNQKVLQTKSQS
nr:hypothetical protein [Candidatus Freyarchaeota archaeon]